MYCNSLVGILNVRDIRQYLKEKDGNDIKCSEKLSVSIDRMYLVLYTNSR